MEKAPASSSREVRTGQGPERRSSIFVGRVGWPSRPPKSQTRGSLPRRSTFVLDLQIYHDVRSATEDQAPELQGNTTPQDIRHGQLGDHLAVERGGVQLAQASLRVSSVGRLDL